MRSFLRLFLFSRAALVAENLFLRKQLALFQERKATPRRTTRTFRLAMVALAGIFDWREVLVIVKPATFLKWHRNLFRQLWRWKSRKRGRPALPSDLRETSRRMERENPTWGEERIADELLVKFGVRVSARTIRKYMRSDPRRGPRGDQRGATFVHNHAKGHRCLRLLRFRHREFSIDLRLRGDGDRLPADSARQRDRPSDGWALFGSIVMVVAAVAFIAASTVVTGGAATALLGVLASSMLSTGVSGIMYTATAGDNFTWRDWAFEVGVGAASGAVTGAFSGVGGVAAKQMAASAAKWAAASATKKIVVKLAQVGIMTAFGAVGGGVGAVTSNAMRRRDKGESGDTGWQGAFARGMAIGTVTGFIGGVGQAWVKPAFKIWAASQEHTTSTFMMLGGTIAAGGAAIIGVAHLPAPPQGAQGQGPNSSPRPQPAPQVQMRFASLGYASPNYGNAMG